ncbi:MAG: hypothetical protein R3E58_06085 [Phycisphaerae bacterium]
MSDLTMIESIYTVIPFFGVGREVALGDPLTRVHEGPGAQVKSPHAPETIGMIMWILHILFVLTHFDSVLAEPAYSVLADVTEDGRVDGDDINLILSNYNEDYSDLD